jgi:hypothetical protein
MFEYHHSDRFILSSLCPYSCSLVDFALRIGGILDPEFLVQCQITDKNIEKLINQLKQIPIKYQLISSNFDYQQEIYLDMDISNKKQFLNSNEFKQYNSWLNDQNQWNLSVHFNDDLII